MSFKTFEKQTQGVQLLQRSLARGRLGHAYLFSGDTLEHLESLARTLAKTLNCQNPVKAKGAATDCCDECLSCRKIESSTHPDIHWARPESKSRVITIDQTRELMQQIQLKPAEAEHKVAIIAAADRLNPQAANAFLKTLEEPPAKSVLILLSTEPQRLLETILSRCLRLNFSGEGKRELNPAEADWLEKFGGLAASEQKSLLGRYRLLDVLLQKLAEIRSQVDENLPPFRRSKNTAKWKKICARNGRTNLPPRLNLNIAVAAPICFCSCNGGCAMFGCIRSPQEMICSIFQKFPVRKPSPNEFRRDKPCKICKHLNKPNGCFTQTCRKPLHSKSAC